MSEAHKLTEEQKKELKELKEQWELVKKETSNTLKISGEVEKLADELSKKLNQLNKSIVKAYNLVPKKDVGLAASPLSEGKITLYFKQHLMKKKFTLTREYIGDEAKLRRFHENVLGGVEWLLKYSKEVE